MNEPKRIYRPWARTAAVLAYLVVTGISTVFAQQRMVRFAPGKIQASAVIREIERQTDFVVAFDKAIYDTTYLVTYSTPELGIEETMAQLLSGTSYDFTIRGSFILINHKPAEKNETAVVPPVSNTARTGDVYRRGQLADIDASPNPRPLVEIPVEVPPDTSVIAEPIALPEPYSQYSPLSEFSGVKTSPPKYALKINLLYAAATFTPNIGFELGLGNKSSLDFSASFNPWKREGTPDDNKKISHAIVRAEYRWWLCERYNGHFFGAHAYYTNFNISGYKVPLVDFEKENRYQGYGFGVGVSYGYHLPLAKRWGLEFNLGLGAAWLNYERYNCRICSEVEESKSKLYIGPTRAGITLVFLIK